MAVGGGFARVPTCTCAIQQVPGDLTDRELLVRALSLLGPGELPVLRAADSAILKLVVSILRREGDAAIDYSQPAMMGQSATSSDAACGISTPTRSLSGALGSLRVVAWPPVSDKHAFMCVESEDRIVSLIERYASTLEELDCPVWPFDRIDGWEQALAACTRLESLTFASNYAPSAWLGLSQLHTLRGVDLRRVSIGAIAAALPRLHTLEIAEDRSGPLPVTAVAGFFECLLPRLQVFHFSASWPKDDPAIGEPPQPLPLLRELSWNCKDSVSGFSNAQPSKLHAPFRVMIAHWLLPGEASCCGQAARGPLARVRHLRLFSYVPTHPEMASVLRAAPDLRTLDAGLLIRDALNWADDPAFEGLIHPRLRSIRVATARAPNTMPNTTCCSNATSLASRKCCLRPRRLGT
jgi:hypothetical protein